MLLTKLWRQYCHHLRQYANKDIWCGIDSWLFKKLFVTCRAKEDEDQSTAHGIIQWIQINLFEWILKLQKKKWRWHKDEDTGSVKLYSGGTIRAENKFEHKPQVFVVTGAQLCESFVFSYYLKPVVFCFFLPSCRRRILALTSLKHVCEVIFILCCLHFDFGSVKKNVQCVT